MTVKTVKNSITGEVVTVSIRLYTKNENYTFILADMDGTFIHNSDSSHTWTIPPQATIHWPNGAELYLIKNGGAGTLTIARGSGVAMYLSGTNSDGDITLNASTRWSVHLLKISDDVWIMIDDNPSTFAGASSNNAAPAGALFVRGGQIGFPATQVASTNVNTLDDYEEGTWTPVVGGTATYTTQVGRYVKIGKQVKVACTLIINAIGTGSTTTISGLPFACVNAGVSTFALAVSYFDTLAANVIFLSAVVTDNATTVTFNSISASGPGMSASAAVLGSGTTVAFSGVYEVA